jgi:hypothetical protein
MKFSKKITQREFYSGFSFLSPPLKAQTTLGSCPKGGPQTLEKIKPEETGMGWGLSKKRVEKDFPP